MGEGRQTNRQEARRERKQHEEEARKLKAENARNEQEHLSFIKRVELASKHHPEIDQNIFRDVIKAYEIEINNQRKKQEEILEGDNSKASKITELQELRCSFMTKVQGHLKEHGPAATAALHAVAEETQSESFFTPIIRMFYNSDRSGPQWGPALSAVLGGAMAFFVGSNIGASPLYILGSTGAVALISAFISNRYFPQEEITPTPNFRIPAPSPAKVKSKSPEATVTEQENDLSIVTSDLVKPKALEGVAHEPINGSPTATYTPGSPKPSGEVAPNPR